MFRFLDNLPEVYINESRDFLLLARLSDVLFSGIKYDIDSMINVLDATLAKDRMLLLMCTKIGFFPRVDIDSQVLKYIIASFPFIIKNKGNIIGILAAVNAILKAENNPDAIGEPRVIIINKLEESGRDPYTIYVYTTILIYNLTALKELLRYVVPAGYAYKLLSYNSILDGYDNPDILTLSDLITALKVRPKYSALIRLPNTSLTVNVNDLNLTESQIKKLENLAEAYVNAYDTTEIATPTSAGGDSKTEILGTNIVNIKSGSTNDIKEIIEENNKG